MVEFHPTVNAFVTGGSDGSFHFWDYVTRSRTKEFASGGLPVVAGAFSPDGSLWAFAQSNDCSRGAAGASHDHNHVQVIAVERGWMAGASDDDDDDDSGDDGDQ